MKALTRKSGLIQITLDLLISSLGLWSGIAISHLESAPAFKLLNILGLTFDLFGVLLLTFVISAPTRVRAFVVNWGAVIGVSITGFFITGFFIGLLVGSEYMAGKDHGLYSHFGPVILVSYISSLFLEDAVMIPKIRSFQNNELRLKFLGGYFVLAGIVIQLYAAFYDLWT